ncbi:MAG: type II/IV secretion system protein [Candidatus Moranbacteria bacterium]|nr:type II/IV secretion system protein [Candidatus Moranbacteria bacterium]
MVKVTQTTQKSQPLHEEETRREIEMLQEKGSEEYASRIARKLSLGYADLHLLPINSDDVSLIKQELSEKYNLVIFFRAGNLIRIGTTDPLNSDTLEFLNELSETNNWEIRLYVISPSSLEQALKQYRGAYFIDSIDVMRLMLTGEELENFNTGIGKLLDLKNKIDSMPTTELLHILFSAAVKLNASDIHLEPQKEGVRLRYRIDGVLQDIVNFPHKTYKLALSRIKLMSGMKINIKREAQDGHFSFSVNKTRSIDVRVSSIPGKKFEGIVMRLLDNESINVQMSELGLIGKAAEDVQNNISKNTGMILTTGPTGSGKTTTLYTLVNHIKTPKTKIITIEDPIEYEIEGISQTEVSKDKNYTFAKGLRAIVRQDPDIILVGEIRDDETANIAINAALTGHLVLSTLHTNNAPATVSRLLELGVKPTLIPAATNIFMAQRLVRKLCGCKERYEPAQETIETLLQMLTLVSPKAKVKIPKTVSHLYKPRGCKKCNQTGYKGRIGIFEVLTMSENIEKLILNMESETAIMKTAIEEGFVTMTQDGVLKAIDGVTSMEEIFRVTSESDLIKSLYDDLMFQTLSRGVFVDIEKQKMSQELSHGKNVINESINKANDQDMLPLIFAYGKFLRASDIHIEPQEEKVFIRMRVDGVLQNIAEIPLINYPPLLGKIKELSNIPTTVRQGVSDSRFRVLYEVENEMKDFKMDVRVSIIAGGFGETVVLRLLNRETVELNINVLGIRPYNLNKIIKEVKKPHGIILNTGPTGSGKTTTLYSLLKEIQSPEVKIITIEDPIEYQLDGILQTQIDQESGYTFSSALRSLLRQDPDIMLVGEIRDNETAETAVNAALTGHLLISSLHTNDAIGAIQRLLNLGISTDDITTSVNAFVAQRLVRKLCDCKKKVKITEEQKNIISKIIENITPKIDFPIPEMNYLYEKVGCEKCNEIGYKSRTVISEILVIDDDLRLVISHGELASEIKKKAIENGMLTIKQDGVLKALEGVTTFDEVKRVTDL